MQRLSNRMTLGRALFVLGLCLVLAPGVQAQISLEADLEIM